MARQEMAMTIAVRVGKTILAMALPVAAMGQYSGVSKPDETAITNVPVQTVQAPVQVAQPVLKPRPGIPVEPDAVAAEVARMPEPMLNGTAAVEVPDVDAGIVTRVPGAANELPVGTLVKVRLTQGISTATTGSGTGFTAELVEAVDRDGRVLLPAGTTMAGLVTDIHGGKRLSGAASIHLRTVSVTLPDGTKYALHGQVIDTNLYREVKVDREGTIFRRDHPGRVAAGMGLTTGSGAAAGAVIGGPAGALIGAGVGAGIGTTVWLKQDRQTELPVDTKVTFWLTESLVVGAVGASAGK